MVRRKSTKSSSLVNKRKSNNTETLVDKKKRIGPGTRALQEIKNLRRSTNLLIPKLPFARLVREIMMMIFPDLDSYRIQASALQALQEAAEMYMVQFFEDSILLSYHCQRVTLMKRDMVLTRRIRGRQDIINH